MPVRVSAGLVIAVSASFYSTIAPLPLRFNRVFTGESAAGVVDAARVPIIVHCPQRHAQPLIYHFNRKTFDLTPVRSRWLPPALFLSFH